MLTVIGVGLMFAAGLSAYAWRRCSAGRTRVIGGLLVLCLPALAFAGDWVWSGLADKTHVFHAVPLEEGVSIFEFLLLLPIIIAPFWLLGALCGYLLGWSVEHPSLKAATDEAKHGQ